MTEKSTRITRSARTTIASTSSLRRPRPPVSVVTAAVIVGENVVTMIVSRSTATSRASPVISGATGSHGHASHASSATPSPTTASVAADMRTMSDRRPRSRSRLIASPAISAMSVVAMPPTNCNCDVIEVVMTLPT
jgi:hypothetical protein